jgi:RES domain-containing protein
VLPIFRLVKQKYADTALEGLGAKRHGGRWNSKGIALVYGSDSIALAALELLVHLKRADVLAHYTVFELEVADDQVLSLEQDALPKDWQADPPPPSTAAIGDEWAESQTSLALAVPSIVIPQQLNLLLNPAHPEYRAVAERSTSLPFAFDHRLA